MKRVTLGVVGSLMLLLLTGTLTFAQVRSFSGEIMDETCANMDSHDGMIKSHKDIEDARDCTLACVKSGSKFVLYDRVSKTVYELDDQQKPVQFAGEKVRVMGTVDNTTHTIRVTDIKKMSESS
jgi:hypothetical protein